MFLCGELMHVGAAGEELQRLTEEESGTVFTPYVLRSIVFFSDTVRFKKFCRRGRLKATRAEGTNGGYPVDDGSR